MNDYYIIDENSTEYPQKLKEINDRPKKLYCKGDLSLLNTRCIAMVGSRKYTMYGKYTAEMIGRKMAEAGIPVVSGLAAGIDSFSHIGVLDGDGKPIAVLGTGLNVTYPKQNKKLQEEVAERGLLISEYEPDCEARPHTFPRRNRIIAGMAESIIVIEASFKSGALITANMCLDMGKTVYAVPGNINSQFSMGTNLLLRDGATPLVVIDDVVRDMGIPVNIEERIKEGRGGLGEDEYSVYGTVADNAGISVDDISHILNIKASKVNAILTILEIKGYITTFSGKAYPTNNS